MGRADLHAVGMALLYVLATPILFIKMPLSIQRRLAAVERSSSLAPASMKPSIHLEHKEGCAAQADLNRRSLIITTMRSVNKVILVGRLAGNPEELTPQAGQSRAVFSLATRRESSSDHAKANVTDYHRVVISGRLGELCFAYLTGGQSVYVEGALQNRTYEENGVRQYGDEIRASEVNVMTCERKGGFKNVSIATVHPE